MDFHLRFKLNRIVDRLENMETNTVVHRDYREPSDENVTDSVQQLVNGGLKLENYQPIRDLEKIKQETSRQLESTHFSTNLEKQLAETVQRNTIASIDTAKDALDVAVNIAGLGTEQIF